MKKWILAPIIVGSVLLIAGGTLLAVGLANKQSNSLTVNEYKLEETISNFDIDIDTAALKLVPSEEAKVVCEEHKKELHEVSVKDGTLSIKSSDTRQWYEKLLSFDFSSPKVTIYLPSGSFEELKIKSSTGNIEVPNEYTFETANIKLSTGDVLFKANVKDDTYIETSTGDISIDSIATNSLTLKASTGNVSISETAVIEDIIVNSSTGHVKLNTVVATNLKIEHSTGKTGLAKVLAKIDIYVKASTGDIFLEDSDAETLHMETSTGDIEGTLLTSKIFYATSDTGKVDVPHSTTGGICELKTSTGNIKISVKELK